MIQTRRINGTNNKTHTKLESKRKVTIKIYTTYMWFTDGLIKFN